jgi:hypothetical protein
MSDKEKRGCPLDLSDSNLKCPMHELVVELARGGVFDTEKFKAFRKQQKDQKINHG